MKQILPVLCALVISSGNYASAENADFYLSPSGSDKWSGKLAEPNADGTDGPFATLERARDAVRILKTSNKENVVVQARGGTYPLEKTVVFSMEDSVAGEATTTYEAFSGETPIFSSGKEITNWKQPETAPERSTGSGCRKNLGS